MKNETLTNSYEIKGYVNRPLSQYEIVCMLKQHDYNDADTVNEALNQVKDLFDMLAFLEY